MNNLLDIKGYCRIYTRMKKISFDIQRQYPLISMMISNKRYPEISIKDILGLLRINGYLRISQDISGYLFGANSQMAAPHSPQVGV
jgi:hypothetical protein